MTRGVWVPASAGTTWGEIAQNIYVARAAAVRKRTAHVIPTAGQPVNTVSAPVTAVALSMMVRSSAPDCTVTFSAKKRARVT